jgi:hypothetical protein
MKSPKKVRRPRSPRVVAPRARLEVESLESRIVPYALAGDVWPHPEMITISFVPDGTIVGVTANGYAYSNLFAKMNAKFGSPAVWEAEILRAAQSWATATNINFGIVSDNGTPIGQGAYQQGDPGMGDIRIGGYAYSPSYLATCFMPPPANNYSIAGDIQFNTSVGWNIGRTYDLFTVAAHEMGHALGLNHSADSTAVMYPSYGGVKSTLRSDDIAGIEANYSGGNPRAADPTSNSTIATATDVSSLIDPIALTALLPTADLNSTSDVDYYTFTAPLISLPVLTINVQSTGLSMLTPAVTLYAGDGTTVLASASDAGHLGGTTLTLTDIGLIEGQQFYIKVAGADSTPFSVGEYAVTLNMGILPSPTVPVPNTETANGTFFHSGGSQNETANNWASRYVSSLFGMTLQASQSLLQGRTDLEATTPAGDDAADRLVLQLTTRNSVTPPFSGAVLDRDHNNLPASFWVAPPVATISIVTPAPTLPPSTVPSWVSNSALQRAITSVFSEPNQQPWTEPNQQTGGNDEVQVQTSHASELEWAADSGMATVEEADLLASDSE